MFPEQYGEQVTALAAEGHETIGVGGLAFRGSGMLRQILAVASQAALNAGINLHTLGIGRLDVLEPHIWSRAISSTDTFSPGDDSHRDSAGHQSYYYWLNGSRLIKMRLDKLYSGEIELPECPCPACRLYGPEIIRFGNKPRNTARDFHNQEIFRRYIDLRFAPERSPASQAREYDLLRFL
jgi:hypothetical protein